jgi:hypothetical protein
MDRTHLKGLVLSPRSPEQDHLPVIDQFAANLPTHHRNILHNVAPANPTKASAVLMKTNIQGIPRQIPLRGAKSSI